VCRSARTDECPETIDLRPQRSAALLAKSGRPNDFREDPAKGADWVVFRWPLGIIKDRSSPGLRAISAPK
jgi:hypothetical protein